MALRGRRLKKVRKISPLSFFLQSLALSQLLGASLPQERVALTRRQRVTRHRVGYGERARVGCRVVVDAEPLRHALLVQLAPLHVTFDASLVRVQCSRPQRSGDVLQVVDLSVRVGSGSVCGAQTLSTKLNSF